MKFKMIDMSTVGRFLYYIDFFRSSSINEKINDIIYITRKNKIKIDKYSLNTIDEI